MFSDIHKQYELGRNKITAYIISLSQRIKNQSAYMKKLTIKFISYLKVFTYTLRPHVFLGFTEKFLLTTYNTLQLTRWIHKNKKQALLVNDYPEIHRDYSKRYDLYEAVRMYINETENKINYLEFGVCEGSSFNWWLANAKNQGNRFWGFDTFEGLPEAWGVFNKGEMQANIPKIDDTRGQFIQGLFQETLPEFIKNHPLDKDRRNVIHLDADLFSSTLYVLTSLSPYLKKGDILLFDEFSVPNHEFFALNLFIESYYIQVKLLGGVNNFFRAAFEII